ncbi:phage tail protein [Pseudomonas viridiflava]|uniref:phage tail protein n=1 Tax=Pseudomonas viridiflava TaxID=33069 RepID=UPI001C3168CA|nr:phage tail protein [Pseudomonas viridiflava]QXG35486.1 phage tail protein [Pseudomonas viridiflava]
MGFRLPNGATLQIASEYGAAIPVTALSNANPTVATAAAHGLADGDIIAVTSGWTRLNDRAARVDNSLSGSFELEKINTLNVQPYPAGSGAGSVREVTAFVEISQITDVGTSGGDQQFTTFGFLADDDDRQLPTSKNPISMSFTVADDPDLPYVAVVEEADEDKQPRVLRLNLPGGSVILYSAYVSITATPTLSRNNVMSRTITISLAGRSTRYSALVA